MLSVIKTALITIVISFISGVLLDTYKNVAPRILCSISRAIPMRSHDKKIKVYILDIKNTSKKTIHNLSVNIQGRYDDLKVDNVRTRGLKYDISKEDSFYNINIPFMIKNDEFYSKIIVEENKYADNEPIVTLRSPDNFKEVRSRVKKESLHSTKNKQNTNNFHINKKVIAAVAVLFLVVYAGVSAFDNFKDKLSNTTVNKEENINKDVAKNEDNTSGKENKIKKVIQNSTSAVKKSIDSSDKNDNSKAKPAQSDTDDNNLKTNNEENSTETSGNINNPTGTDKDNAQSSIEENNTQNTSPSDSKEQPQNEPSQPENTQKETDSSEQVQ